MIRVASGEGALLSLLANHPSVEQVTKDGKPGLRWHDGDVEREITSGNLSHPLFGVIELIDNNPLVCALSFSVPTPVATVALIALGPLAQAGLLLEPPAIAVNCEEDPHLIDESLKSVGWFEGVDIVVTSEEEEAVISATVIASIKTPEDLDDLDALYDEKFGRSFFVRRIEEGEWDASFVAGKPFAAYRLQIAEDQPSSLLTIRVLADKSGKAGAAQLIHAMNVMQGYEETLGLDF